MKIIIKSKKQLFKLLPSEYQDMKIKKLIGRVFSIGVSNYWTVEYENLILTFTYENNFICCIGQVALKNIATVTKIDLNTILFKQSGFKVNLNYNNYYYFLTSDNIIFSCTLNSPHSLYNFCLQYNRSDFVSVSTSFGSITNEIIKKNFNCFRKLEWNEFGSYSGLLCIKDCGPFRKGMIVDTYYQHLEYKYYERDPLELVNKGLYAGMHRIDNNISCNLSNITLEQLEAINTESFSCNKQKFGCQHGCTSVCYSESANSSDLHRKNTFIKLWKECFA